MVEAFIKLHEKGLIYQGIILLLAELFFFPLKGKGAGGSTFLQSDPVLNQLIGAKEEGATFCFLFSVCVFNCAGYSTI